SWALGWLSDGRITIQQILAIIFGGLVIIIVGFLDDKYDLRTKSFLGPFVGATLAVALGVAIKYITNPFIAGTGPYGMSLLYFSPFIGPIFSFLWLLGMMYTTKFLDGLDGLVSGIGAIGAIILFIVSLFWDVAQSSTSIMCLILAGSCLGFLRFNWHPARIFLGESGSVFIGFMLGVLSIISGGKIATALLIMGIPILDVLWVIFRRIFKEKKSPFSGDGKHLHFRLLDTGFSHRGAVLFLYFLTLVFGASSLFLQSQNKVIALAVLGIVMIVLAAVLIKKCDQNSR
ncbi:MAG: MraY family glycosyltransferase, partial [Candidatus Kuenenbacteria bacterium]